MRNKLPGAQMTSVVIWAQCGSFAAICSVVRGGRGMAVAVVVVDGAEKVVVVVVR